MNDGRIGVVKLRGQRVGTLTEAGPTYSFLYDPAYLRRAGQPISPTMRLQAEAFVRTGLHPLFANLLPQGPVRTAKAATHLLYERDDFGLLLALGADLPGALEVFPATDRDLLDSLVLSLPGVTRIQRHGPLTNFTVGGAFRVLLQESVGTEGLLSLGADAAELVLSHEKPDQFSVELEPGELPDGYKLDVGEDNDGEPPDPGPFPVHAGTAPTRRWSVWAFRSPDNEVGVFYDDKARAIDAAWDDLDALSYRGAGAPK